MMMTMRCRARSAHQASIATRYLFTSRIEVGVNGQPGQLVNLSVAGCGIRTRRCSKWRTGHRCSCPAKWVRPMRRRRDLVAARWLEIQRPASGRA